MPGCKMSFKKSAGGGGGRIKSSGTMIAVDREIDPTNACAGGDVWHARKAPVETAAPPVKAAAGGTKRGGGMFG